MLDRRSYGRVSQHWRSHLFKMAFVEFKMAFDEGTCGLWPMHTLICCTNCTAGQKIVFGVPTFDLRMDFCSTKHGIFSSTPRLNRRSWCSPLSPLRPSPSRQWHSRTLCPLARHSSLLPAQGAIGRICGLGSSRSSPARFVHDFQDTKRAC